MNLAHSDGKPGVFASYITLNVRFVPASIIKFKIKESHENTRSKTSGSIGVIVRSAGEKPVVFSGTSPQSGAIC